MVRIGKIVATHGLQGIVILKHTLPPEANLEPGQVVFLELMKESYIPFFIKTTRVKGSQEFLLLFEETDGADEARKLIGKNVYLEGELLQNIAKESPLSWLGFEIIDKGIGRIGEVEDILETGHQWLAKTTFENKEVLIPLVKPILCDVHIIKKQLEVKLPNGLLEM